MDGSLSCLIIATSILIIGVRCHPILVTPGCGLPAPYYCYSYWRSLLSVSVRNLAAVPPLLCQRLSISPLGNVSYSESGLGDLECELRILPTLLLPSQPVSQPTSFSTANSNFQPCLQTSLKTFKHPYLQRNRTD